MTDKVNPKSNTIYLSNLVCETLVMVSLYTVFVTILFFTYGKYIETAVAKNNANLLVKSLTSDLKFFGTQLAPDEFHKLESVLKNLNPPDMSEADQEIKDQNSALMKRTMLIVLSSALGAIIFGLLLWVFLLKRPVKQYFTFIFPHAIILLIFVAIVEMCFFFFISRNYRSLDPNIAKKALIDAFLTQIDKST